MTDKERLLTDEELFNLHFKTAYKQYQPELLAYEEGCIDGSKAQLAKCEAYYKPLIEQKDAEIKSLKKSVSELVEAMHRYEMDVDVEAPITHRQMMERANQALNEVK